MALFTKEVIDSGEVGPHLLITAGVHGDEFEPMQCIHALMDKIPGQLNNGKLTLVPCVNLEAFLLGDRTASDHLDLARICPGDPAGSITLQVGHELSELIKSADYYIDLHTGGTRFSVYPLTGYPLNPNEQTLAGSRKMAQAFNLPFIWGTDGRLKGRSMSIACEHNIPAIYAEYKGAAVCDSQGVTDYIDGCLNVLGMLGMIDREQPVSRVKTVVEDPREGSGHMQICHPAPFDGLLTPAYQLGDCVSQGEVLGKVRTIDGEQTAEVLAAQSGTIIVLHTFPMVREGDAMFVIA
ncbi:MAG: M14 family metallopeptidase [Planctomycetota bacterium]|nr:M14 family metallopeptidase [Planctomycetota bacterium]